MFGGVVIDRILFVAAGQIIPTTAVGGVVSDPYVAYTPSLVEISIVVGAFAFIAFLYTLAERYLDMREPEEHVSFRLPAFVTTAGEGLAERRAARAAAKAARRAERAAARAQALAMADALATAEARATAQALATAEARATAGSDGGEGSGGAT